MKYAYEQIRALPPAVHQKAIQSGTLDASHMVIDLPSDFDFNGPTPPEAPEQLRGLGDLVASIAKPIARAVDGVLGTDLEHCGGCAQRQEVLNDVLPFKH